MTVNCETWQTRWRVRECNVLALSAAEQNAIEADLEHEDRLRIGSRAEIAVLSALTKRYEAIDTEGSLAIFDLIDVDGNGVLTKKELLKGVEMRAVRDYVSKTRNATLKNLLKTKRRKTFDKVFATIDISGNGVITKDDFTKFVREMALERVRYMKVVGLLNKRCFWGRGLSDDEEVPVKNSCCWPRGYGADFWFYAKNNHPYLALFLRDEAHPFSRRDAFCAELIKQCYCLAASLYIDGLERRWMEPSGFIYNWKLSIVYVALPSMVIEELLFYLVACPCLRFERRGRRRECCLRALEKAADCLGRTLIVLPLCLVSFTLFIYGAFRFYNEPTRQHSQFLFFWVGGLLSEYFLTWPLLHLFVHFNALYPDCRRLPFRHGCVHGCCGAWHWFNCGRWATERRQAADLALNADDDLYDDLFFNGVM